MKSEGKKGNRGHCGTSFSGAGSSGCASLGTKGEKEELKGRGAGDGGIGSNLRQRSREHCM